VAVLPHLLSVTCFDSADINQVCPNQDFLIAVVYDEQGISVFEIVSHETWTVRL
jgi:hypothetical protein